MTVSYFNIVTTVKSTPKREGLKEMEVLIDALENTVRIKDIFVLSDQKFSAR